MAFPTATAPTDTATSESTINDLLGADLAPVETETPVEEDTSVTEPEVEVEDAADTEVVEGDESTEEAPAEGDETEGDEEPESGEEDFNVTDLETDYAESAYALAAIHYSKQFGKKYDANDPADRKMLREFMDRGRDFERLKSEQSEAETGEESTEETPATVKDAPVLTPAQQLDARIKTAREYAKSSVNPVVAKEAVLPMMEAIAEFIWPGKGKQALEGRTEAQLADLTAALSLPMIMQLTDAIPSILGQAPAVMEQRYPYMPKMHEMAEKEAAVDEILGATDKAGAAAYPGFGKLVDSGAINRALQNPELKDAVFSKDAFKNRVAKLKFAYKLARNERVDPALLAKASARGKASERERQTRVAAGRTSPGSSERSTAPGKSNFLQQLVGGGESGSAKLFKNVGRRQA